MGEAAPGPPEMTAESVEESETSTIAIATVTNEAVSETAIATETVIGVMAEISAQDAHPYHAHDHLDETSATVTVMDPSPS